MTAADFDTFLLCAAGFSAALALINLALWRKRGIRSGYMAASTLVLAAAIMSYRNSEWAIGTIVFAVFSIGLSLYGSYAKMRQEPPK